MIMVILMIMMILTMIVTITSEEDDGKHDNDIYKCNESFDVKTIYDDNGCASNLFSCFLL